MRGLPLNLLEEGKKRQREQGGINFTRVEKTKHAMYIGGKSGGRMFH